VDDSAVDYEATLRAFQRARIANLLYRCADGAEALDYLLRRGKFEASADSPTPGLILLDLNIPGMDGREILRTIKATPNLARIPVVVLTTSSDQHDIDACYAEGASGYICKPVDFESFMDGMRRLKDYWLGLVLLPRVYVLDG